jgi:hypothetical protein
MSDHHHNNEKETKDLTTSGIVFWGYDDFVQGNAYTKMWINNQNNNNQNNLNNDDSKTKLKLKQLSNKEKCRIFGSVWKPLSQIDARWAFLQSTENPLLKNVYAKDCGAGGDCMYKVIACTMNSLWKLEIFDFISIRKMAAEQLTIQTLPAFLMTWDMGAQVEKFSQQQQLQIAQQFILTKGCWGQICVLELLVQSSVFQRFKFGFAIITVSDRKRPLAVNVNATPMITTTTSTTVNVNAPLKTTSTSTSTSVVNQPFSLYANTNRKSQRLSLKNSKSSMTNAEFHPVGLTQIIRKADTEHLLLLLNVSDYHYMALGVIRPKANLTETTTNKSTSNNILSVSVSIEKEKEKEMVFEPAIVFPIKSYPGELMPYLREK